MPAICRHRVPPHCLYSSSDDDNKRSCAARKRRDRRGRPVSAVSSAPLPISVCIGNGDRPTACVLLMGKSGSGKTSMRSIIFANYIARDTRRLGATKLLRNLQRSCLVMCVIVIMGMQAWSSIVYTLIPNVQQLESNLQQFTNIIDANEVLLFERATFLIISHCQRKPHHDVHRFEKVSNIIKQFKLSCSKLAAQFQSMEVRNSNFAAFIDVFTPNTYIMVIMADPTMPPAATLINIKNARKHFEKLESAKGSSSQSLARR
ncbi:hypothetical protein HPB51_026249 [Rhipicephalus microplus]|uniref:Ras-related GTP-binding protein A n=1 Tax=Rhipicephalus microplus TaxID=6941 RepID=A0A9J6D7V0_RHIMP|nr:hypothetical protein HPB51_026249 [Rhipicephalus microplus]